MVTATVFLRCFVMPSVAGAIALAADNRFEYLFLFCFYQRRNLLQACLLFGGKSFFPFEGFLFFFQVFDGSKRFPVLLGDLVEELLYTEDVYKRQVLESGRITAFRLTIPHRIGISFRIGSSCDR